MKKHAYLLLLVSVLCLSVSCSKDTLSDAPATHPAALVSSPYTISMDSVRKLALSLPQVFSDSPATRSAGKVIKEVVPFSRFVQSPATRSAGGDDPTANIYVVNYAGNAGFAIISADTRMQDVLGYSDSGNISDTMSNPGMRLFMACVPDYAEQAVSRIIADTFPDAGGGGGTLPPIYSIETKIVPLEQWHGTVVGPLVQVRWDQEWPFNMYAPFCNNHTSSHRTLAGCVTVAMVQIMSYHKQPQHVPMAVMQWDKYLTYEYGMMFPHYETDTTSLAPAISMGHLCKYIGDLAATDFACGNSTSTIKDADIAFKTLGIAYSTDGVTNYTPGSARVDLHYGRPVFVSGRTADNIGHAWVVDGYKDQLRRVMKITSYYLPFSETLVKTESEEYTESRNYVYCNWGWNGSNNGWFYDSAFDAFNSAQPAETDPDSYYDNEPQFNKKIQMIKNLRYGNTQ